MSAPRAEGSDAPAFPQSDVDVGRVGRRVARVRRARARDATRGHADLAVRVADGEPAGVRRDGGDDGVGEPRDRRRHLGGRGRRRQAAAGRQRHPRPRDRRVRGTLAPRCPTARTPRGRASATPSRRPATPRRSCSRSGRRPPRRRRRPTPTATPTPEASPVPVAAVAPPSIRGRHAPYVCTSRRDFTKHVFRPYGTKLRVAATLDGRPLRSVIGRKEIRIRIDLRGKPKDTYTLRVAISRTRDGKRIRPSRSSRSTTTPASRPRSPVS